MSGPGLAGACTRVPWFAVLDRAVDILAAGRGLRGRRRERLLAALRLAVEFPTWQTLTAAGLGDRNAPDVARNLVAVTGGAEQSQRRAA